MKKRKKKKGKVLDKSSLTMRDLVRHKMPRPSLRMRSEKDYDRKKERNPLDSPEALD